MKTALFKPFGLGGGLIAGLIAEKIFEKIWARFDHEEEAPKPKHREVGWRKLMAALAVEGAILRLVRGSFDHGARAAFRRMTGEWPGDKSQSQS